MIKKLVLMLLGGSAPQVYSYRPNDHRYGGASYEPMANQSTVQKYAGAPAGQPAIQNPDFRVSSIARGRIERQQVAPPQNLNAPRQPRHYERNSTPDTAYQPAARHTTTAARQPAPVAAAPVGNSGRITVQQGDTLFSLSQRHKVSVAALRTANGLATNDIRIGQQLVIPGAGTAADRSRKPVRMAAKNSTTAPGTGAAPRTLKVPQAAPVTQRTPTPSRLTQPAARSKQQPARMAKVNPARPMATATPRNNFRWPVRGRILTRFGAKADGSHNDGVNLAVPRGTEIRAAESGVVAYAGSELKAYGKLILIRHPNNWVTAYAHNDEILVKRGDKVRRGQVISRAGTTGSVTQPQLHFELRKGSSPVDPMKYIAGS